MRLLICGYIRESEIELDLYMNIPKGIDKIMHDLYSVLLFKFGEHKNDIFKFEADKTIIRGNKGGCNGYLVYADLGQFNDIGLNKGIHILLVN